MGLGRPPRSRRRSRRRKPAELIHQDRLGPPPYGGGYGLPKVNSYEAILNRICCKSDGRSDCSGDCERQHSRLPHWAAVMGGDGFWLHQNSDADRGKAA
jgi:hypothetical protein